MRLPIRAEVVAVGSGVAYGVAARLVFEGGQLGGYGTMTLAFVVLVPLAVGFLAVALTRGGGTRMGRAVVLPTATAVACLAVVLAIGLEGPICVTLVAPLFLLFAMMGGVMARAIRGLDGRRHAVAFGAVLLLPYAAAPLESRMPLPRMVRTVEARVVVRADAATVWRMVVFPTGIRPEENRAGLAHRMGFPRPVTASLSAHGVGGSRYAVFERGVTLRETVTEWVPERRMAFTIRPAIIPPRALDRHVAIGSPFFDVTDGSYEIVPLDSGRVELRLSTTHRLSTRFNPYAAFWTRLLMRQIQGNLVHVVRARAEAEAQPSFPAGHGGTP